MIFSENTFTSSNTNITNFFSQQLTKKFEKETSQIQCLINFLLDIKSQLSGLLELFQKLFVNEKCARLDLYEAIYNTLVLYDTQKNDVYRLKIMEALSAYYADKKVTCPHTNDRYKLLEMLELLYNKMQSYIKMEHDQDHKECDNK